MTLRVLLVEDDDAYARLVRELLRDQHEVALVATASTLVDGIAAAQQHHPDVVLLDLGLPDSEGVATIAAFHQAHARVPIVVLSGLDSIAVTLDAMRFGAQEYLVKGQGEAHLLPRVCHAAIERKRLQEVEQLLVGVVSHDLRGPLQTIALTCELLAHEVGDASKPKVARALSAARRAEGLVNDLLDATSARLGGLLPIQAVEIDLVPLVEGIVTERAQVAQREIALTAPTSLIIRADERRIAQVVANLVANATQHSPRGTTVEVALARGAEVSIVVANAGGPIPPALLERLFEPLERAQAPNESHSIGLGLYIVHEIVKAHGGSIAVASTAGRTQFTVTLPA